MTKGAMGLPLSPGWKGISLLHSVAGTKACAAGQRGRQKTRHGYPAGLWHSFRRCLFIVDARFNVNADCGIFAACLLRSVLSSEEPMKYANSARQAREAAWK